MGFGILAGLLGGLFSLIGLILGWLSSFRGNEMFALPSSLVGAGSIMIILGSLITDSNPRWAARGLILGAVLYPFGLSSIPLFGRSTFDVRVALLVLVILAPGLIGLLLRVRAWRDARLEGIWAVTDLIAGAAHKSRALLTKAEVAGASLAARSLRHQGAPSCRLMISIQEKVRIVASISTPAKVVAISR